FSQDLDGHFVGSVGFLMAAAVGVDVADAEINAALLGSIFLLFANLKGLEQRGHCLVLLIQIGVQLGGCNQRIRQGGAKIVVIRVGRAELPPDLELFLEVTLGFLCLIGVFGQQMR